MMDAVSQRKIRIVTGVSATAGVVMLVMWMFAVTGYAYQVDAEGLIAEVRTQDILLFAVGATLLVTATTVHIARRRKAR